MSDAIKIETNAAELIQRFDRLPDAVQKGILSGIGKALTDVEGRFLQNPGVKLAGGRSGLASRLTNYARRDSIDGVDAAIGFRKTRHFPYELSQEFGAKAKAGGAMVVPISPLAKSFSQRGLGPREGFASGRLKVIKTHTGAYLAERLHGRRVTFGVGLIWHYKLIKSLPARMRFRQTVLDAIPTISNQILNGAREGWAAV